MDFIKENIIYKVNEIHEEKIMKIILNHEEESVPVERNDSQSPQSISEEETVQVKIKESQRPQALNKNIPPILSKKIMMKSYFDCLLCCKRKESIRYLLSDAAQEFLK